MYSFAGASEDDAHSQSEQGWGVGATGVGGMEDDFDVRSDVDALG